MGKRKKHHGVKNARASTRTRLPLSRLRERVANAADVSLERVASSIQKPSPARRREGSGRQALPQAGEGKASARLDPRTVTTASFRFDPGSETLDDEQDAFHKIAEAVPEAMRNAIRQKFAEAYELQRKDTRRQLNTIFLLWHVCRNKACRRVSRCMGDPYACHDRFGPSIPERQRRFFQFFLEAARGGASNADAIRAATAKCAQFADVIAQAEERQIAALRASEEAARRSPSPLVGEGSEQSEPGEGFLR